MSVNINRKLIAFLFLRLMAKKNHNYLKAELTQKK